jgi:hypothetical protein
MIDRRAMRAAQGAVWFAGAEFSVWERVARRHVYQYVSIILMLWLNFAVQPCFDDFS